MRHLDPVRICKWSGQFLYDSKNVYGSLNGVNGNVTRAGFNSFGAGHGVNPEDPFLIALYKWAKGAANQCRL